jgi:hypothetical protein
MNIRPNAFAISSPREHFAALGLAATVTLTLLASVGGVADRQYENALVAPGAALPTLIATHPAAPARG